MFSNAVVLIFLLYICEWKKNDHFYLPTKGSHVIKYVPFGENSKLETFDLWISANTFHDEVATTLTLKLETLNITTLQVQIDY